MEEIKQTIHETIEFTSAICGNFCWRSTPLIPMDDEIAESVPDSPDPYAQLEDDDLPELDDVPPPAQIRKTAIIWRPMRLAQFTRASR